jgi:hypothetical protein
MQRQKYGMTKLFGGEIDHIVPVVEGGTHTTLTISSRCSGRIIEPKVIVSRMLGVARSRCSIREPQDYRLRLMPVP